MTLSGAGPYRLPQGGMIDRDRSIPFRFNNKTYEGCAGDSLASALLASGVRTVARSFKFHRPRGVFSCGMEEPGAVVQLGVGARTVPAVRAPLVQLREGLQVRSNAGWPSVDFDVGRVLDWTAPLWAAGFYNKTFIWPSWHTYEPLIRRMAGIGRAPPERDPDRYEAGNLHCDVLIVGGGMAGLRAALEAGGAGLRVVLAEQDRQFGGAGAWNGATIEGVPARTWITDTLTQLEQLGVRLLSRTMVTGHYDHSVVTLLETPASPENSSYAPRERYWIVRARRIVLATGVIEQPLVFANNDRPGVVLASAARQYLHRYGVAIGSRVLIATNNDSAYGVAEEFKAAGIDVLGVADSRSEVPEAMHASLRGASIPFFARTIPVDTAGFGALREVTLGEFSADGSRIESQQTIRCDALAVSGGFNPTLHLYAQSGGRLVYDDSSGSLVPTTSGAFWPATRHPTIDIVGAAASRVPIGPRISPIGNPNRKWVDLLHDVTVADLELALRENFTSVEHVKRYTTVGMAADQGKTSNAVALDVIGKLRGVPTHELGHTTFRPPFMPVPLGAIAGREIGDRFAPHRLLPMHDWHLAHGAVMHDFGEWRRPVVYVKAGETRQQAAKREALAVRTAAGLFDGSPLGKIEIHGPDALQFLDHFYINDLTTLKSGRVRYGLMLRETGTILDDGTVVMMAPDRFLITTTSGGVGRVTQWLEEWRQCEWPELRVVIMPVTEAWATLSIAGPKARAVLSKLSTDIDLSGAAFPHLSMREGTVMGSPARIYRVSFTGELSFEINVPAKKGPALWSALMNAGATEGLEPIGLDALLLLRLEKGFLHLGSDTDGTTVPDDVGWGKVAASKKRDFVGKRSLTLPAHVASDRLQLIGLAGNGGRPFVIGSHLRVQGSKEATDGWITSAGNTVLTNEPIALAMLLSGRARVGAEVDLYDAGAVCGTARVVSPPFFDAAGERVNA